MIFDAAYFLAKFSTITPERYVRERFTEPNATDAFGHCGEITIRDSTDEGRALSKLMKSHGLGVISVEWGKSQFKLGSPRQNILAALRWIIEQEAHEG